MDLVIFLIVLVVAAVVVRSVVKTNQRKALERKQAELEPVRKLAFEDVTALGEELQFFDLELAGRPLDPGANADYQRAHRWEARFRAEGMRYPEARIRMIDGFNEGWIDFERSGAEQRCGTVTLDAAIRALVAPH